MYRSKAGFILIEAVAAVVIVSVCLTLITQTVMTNFHAGLRFQETARALLAMENKMGGVLADPGRPLEKGSQVLPLPYESFSATSESRAIKDGLNQVNVTISWDAARGQRHFPVVTLVYDKDHATKSDMR